MSATDQEVLQGREILERRGWSILKSRDGWVINDAKGKRVWPTKTSQSVPDPWLGLASADANVVEQLPHQGRRAARALQELERGVRLRPRRVTVPDPDGGSPVEIIEWDLLADRGPATVIGVFPSALAALKEHRANRISVTS